MQLEAVLSFKIVDETAEPVAVEPGFDFGATQTRESRILFECKLIPRLLLSEAWILMYSLHSVTPGYTEG